MTVSWHIRLFWTIKPLCFFHYLRNTVFRSFYPAFLSSFVRVFTIPPPTEHSTLFLTCLLRQSHRTRPVCLSIYLRNSRYITLYLSVLIHKTSDRTESFQLAAWYVFSSHNNNGSGGGSGSNNNKNPQQPHFRNHAWYTSFDPINWNPVSYWTFLIVSSSFKGPTLQKMGFKHRGDGGKCRIYT